MLNINSKALSVSAKRLRYQIEEKEFSYDELIEYLQANPSQFLQAESICWIVPKGFIVFNEDKSQVRDYIKTLEEFSGEDLPLAKSTLLGMTLKVEEILEDHNVEFVYSNEREKEVLGLLEIIKQDFNPKEVESSEKPEFATFLEDMYIYVPKYSEVPFFLLKGSSVPTSFLEEADFVAKSSGDKEKDLIKYNKLVTKHKAKKDEPTNRKREIKSFVESIIREYERESGK